MATSVILEYGKCYRVYNTHEDKKAKCESRGKMMVISTEPTESRSVTPPLVRGNPEQEIGRNVAATAEVANCDLLQRVSENSDLKSQLKMRKALLGRKTL